MPKKYRSKLHRFHYEAKKEVQGKENVLGVGLGVKVVDGRTQADKCVTILVRSKKSKRVLSRKDRISKTMIFDDRELPTDVIEVGEFRPQNGPVAFGDSLSVNNAYFGTRTAYFPAGGIWHALTCAHVLWGPGAGPATPIPPQQQVNSLDMTGIYTWKPLGMSDADGNIGFGNGSMGDYGYIDYITLSIPPPVLAVLPIPLQPLPCFQAQTLQDYHNLAGTYVVGQGARSLTCRGIITAVFIANVANSGKNADFIVIPQNPAVGLTREGDSGLLWRANNGAAIGMHCLGNSPPNNAPSSVGVGSFIQRIANRLSIPNFF